MVESGQGGEGSAEAPAARFARIEAEITKCRRQLASLRHEGERHFIDNEPVHPEVPGLLEEVVQRGGELEHLRAMASGSHAVNPAVGKPQTTDDDHRRLDDLEARITRLNELSGDDPHKHERHFIDG